MKVRSELALTLAGLSVFLPQLLVSLPSAFLATGFQALISRPAYQGHEVVEWGNKPIAKVYSLLRRLFTDDGGKTIRSELEREELPFKFMETFLQSKEIGIFDMWHLQRERNQMRKEWRDQRNDIEGLDGIIMAAAPYISAKHSNYTHAGYKGVFNKATREEYDPDEINGLSVGPQPMGMKLQVEKVLAVVERVLEAVNAAQVIELNDPTRRQDVML
ncbi:hypothetical protein V496_03132 [Pseudogymnoascus sp. VKM F-4515 (FW-2607)]|nr:hypothetical protein V496_03132 [Pseudogymnoascus sp. VKM F-4515 (FW-2607)]KFY91519.1 hypothetical protein V498_05422 [Pseudogymnoascus sp. VKM F-4517 (FW-2822)]